MYQEERWVAILDYLQQHGRISTDDICELLKVSRDTARRDLVKLEEDKKIVRTHGGAILPTLTKDVPVYAERLQAETGPKRAIGRLAASYIKDGDYVLMDSSTTVRWAAEFLQTKRNIVVTNSVDVATTLGDKSDVSVHLLGGILRGGQRSVYGARAVAMLADYQVDRLLIGTCGITVDGLSSPYEEEGFLCREMIRRADQVIVLADHSKFGKRLFHRFASLSDIDVIVTDQLPSPELQEALERHRVDIAVTEPQGG
ncbi:DeoR/GlpR family DNA-binding transcription regulator [Paenibacillus chartarius]|uniref:DeoR/GlpR family DNA-binding transcription regulator n=1 Tax=Paenibacillus chartarius TaxID=747481 RepID=A0ABV6DJ99_9BACL